MTETTSITNPHDIPIPLELPSIEGWKEISIINFRTETKEDDLRDLSLAPLGFLSEYPTIYTDSIYGSERDSSPYDKQELRNPIGLEDPLLTMFTRPSVADGLIKAQALLPPGHYLIVHDAYRPLPLQGALFSNYYQELQKQHSDWTDEQLSAETQKYVSLPSTQRSRPSPHNTGGSVDVAIISVDLDQDKRIKEIEDMLAALPPYDTKKYFTGTLSNDDFLRRYDLEMEMNAIKAHGTFLNFGTNFDYGDQEAALDYYEKLAKKRALSPEEVEAAGNRRLLYHAMIDAGFQPYQFEWWHFNSPKSQMGAKTAGLEEARFGPITIHENPGNQQHEWLRQNLIRGGECRLTLD